MKFWVSSAFLFYSPPTFSNPISKIEINQNFFLCKSYSKTSKKILNSWTWTGTKTKDLQGSQAFLGRLNLGKQHKLRVQGGQVWGDKKCVRHLTEKFHLYFGGKDQRQVRKKMSHKLFNFFGQPVLCIPKLLSLPPMHPKRAAETIWFLWEARIRS